MIIDIEASKWNHCDVDVNTIIYKNVTTKTPRSLIILSVILISLEHFNFEQFLKMRKYLQFKAFQGCIFQPISQCGYLNCSELYYELEYIIIFEIHVL